MVGTGYNVGRIKRFNEEMFLTCSDIPVIIVKDISVFV